MLIGIPVSRRVKRKRTVIAFGAAYFQVLRIEQSGVQVLLYDMKFSEIKTLAYKDSRRKVSIKIIDQTGKAVLSITVPASNEEESQNLRNVQQAFKAALTIDASQEGRLNIWTRQRVITLQTAA